MSKIPCLAFLFSVALSAFAASPKVDQLIQVPSDRGVAISLEGLDIPANSIVTNLELHVAKVSTLCVVKLPADWHVNISHEENHMVARFVPTGKVPLKRLIGTLERFNDVVQLIEELDENDNTVSALVSLSCEYQVLDAGPFQRLYCSSFTKSDGKYRPNKPVEVTPTAVTPAADAPGAPSAGAPHH